MRNYTYIHAFLFAIFLRVCFITIYQWDQSRPKRRYVTAQLEIHRGRVFLREICRSVLPHRLQSFFRLTVLIILTKHHIVQYYYINKFKLLTNASTSCCVRSAINKKEKVYLIFQDGSRPMQNTVLRVEPGQFGFTMFVKRSPGFQTIYVLLQLLSLRDNVFYRHFRQFTLLLQLLLQLLHGARRLFQFVEDVPFDIGDRGRLLPERLNFVDITLRNLHKSTSNEFRSLSNSTSVKLIDK